MKKLLLIISSSILAVGLFLLNIPMAEAAAALVTNSSCASFNQTSGCNTAAKNTTGATLLVATIVCFSADSSQAGAVSDSNANTWNVAKNGANGTSNVTIWYAYSKSGGALVTSASHSLSTPNLGGYCSLTWEAFSGTVTASDPLDKTSSAASQSTTSITPLQNNEVVVSGHGNNSQGGSASIDSSYTITDTVLGIAAGTMADSNAYLIQTSAAATAPIWTFSSNGPESLMASFKTPATTVSTAFVLVVGGFTTFKGGYCTIKGVR